MIHHGDLFDVLPTLAAESVDACVTDPPYGIGFMGREWDTFTPGESRACKGLHANQRIGSTNPNLRGRRRAPAVSPSQIEYNRSLDGQRGFQTWTARWAAEVHRVLKPGAYLVVCGAPRSHHRMMCGLEDAGFVIRDCFAWLFGSGFPKNYNLGDGKGTALKPAHEPIALAWKPFKGSIKACHQQHGTAALNVDACRLNPGEEVRGGGNGQAHNGGRFGAHETSGSRPVVEAHDLGRWPANVLLDEEAAAQLDEQTGFLHPAGFVNPSAIPPGKYDDTFGGIQNARTPFDYKDGGGGASRFYYVAKPSREERDYGHGANKHPTVKPIELMRWLVRLVVPIGGVCLDPFTGSGTTGMACRYELREFVGIEREAEYLAIAERRIAAVCPLFSTNGSDDSRFDNAVAGTVD